MKREIKIFAMSCSNYIISGFFNTLTSVLAAYFLGDIKMSTGVLGIFFSMGGILTAVAATIPGRIVDKIGAKKGMILTCIAQLVAFGLFPLAHSAVMLMVLVSVNSIATALSTPCNTQVLRALDVKDPAKLLRINMVGTSVAALGASALAAALVDNFGFSWRGSFAVFFVISVIVGIIGMLLIASVKLDFSGITVTKVKDENEEKKAKAYQFTPAEKMSRWALALLYIGYMGVGISLSLWLPALLSNKGFSGVQASMPTTVGTITQLIAYLFLPTLFAKAMKSTKVTPVVAAGMVLVVLGTMASSNIYIICLARGILAIVMSFISMHVQSDMALVAPLQAAGRFSSFILAAANAGGVLAVILLGYIPANMQMALLLTFTAFAVIGALMFIKPAKQIMEEKSKAEKVAA